MIRQLLLVLCLSAVAFAQTAIYPGGVADDQDLTVQKDRASSYLTAAISNSTLSVAVANGSKFTAYQIITIGTEQMQICSIDTNTLTICTGARGFAGTAAAAHGRGSAVNGNMVAYPINALSKEIQAIETALAGGTGVSLQNLVFAESYGAVGDGTTDDTTALQSAITAVQGTGKTLLLTKSYKVTADIDITDGDFTIDGGGTIVQPTANAESVNGFHIAGSLASETGPATDRAFATRATTTSSSLDVDSAAAYSVGDYILFQYDDATYQYNQLTSIKSKATNTLGLVDPIVIPLEASETTGVWRAVPVLNLRIRNLTFDGSGVTGTPTYQRGLMAEVVFNSTFENLRFVGYGIVGAAAYESYCYGNTWRNIRLEDSGGADGSESDFFSVASSNGVYSEIHSENSPGFGPQWMYPAMATLDNVSSINAAWRGIKFSRAAYVNGTNITAVGNGHMGVAISNGSYRITLTNVTANGNSDNGGVWIAGSDAGESANISNSFLNVSAFSNQTTDILIQAGVTNGNTDNLFLNVSAGSITDSGTGNILVLSDTLLGGVSKAVSVRKGDDSGACTMTFTTGILTSQDCTP